MYFYTFSAIQSIWPWKSEDSRTFVFEIHYHIGWEDSRTFVLNSIRLHTDWRKYLRVGEYPHPLCCDTELYSSGQMLDIKNGQLNYDSMQSELWIHRTVSTWDLSVYTTDLLICVFTFVCEKHSFSNIEVSRNRQQVTRSTWIVLKLWTRERHCKSIRFSSKLKVN